MAQFMLIGWPLVVLILFRRTSLPVALACSVIAGYLLLPTKVDFNLPLLPLIGKNLIPSAAAAVMAYVILRQRAVLSKRRPEMAFSDTFVRPGWLPRSRITRGLLLILILGAFMTAWTNGDRLIYGSRALSNLSTYDAFSTTMNTLVGLLPLFLARKFLAHPDHHRTLLLIFCLAGLLYSLPALYEVRMSPQLNKIIYGFFPSDWRQARRGDGFRPLVFLKHGLLLGLFLSSALLAAIAYWRATRTDWRWFIFAGAGWLFMTLILAKSLGALLTVIFLAPILLFLSVRLQLLAAAAIAVLVLTYPVLRGTDLVPVAQVASMVEKINPARAQSFQTRLSNENWLLRKANERPAFGWGKWGRARVYDDQGRDFSRTDGLWVITIGEGGWARYIGEFGLLALPILLLTLHRRRYEISLATSGLALVLAANLLDLIPNSGLTPITWLMAGALLGRLELQNLGAQVSQPAPLTPNNPAATSRYSRPRPVRPDPRPDPATPAPDLRPDPARSRRLAYTRQKPTGAKT